ncbi:MAG: Helicase associated domain protein [Actinomycetota bacterium]
MSQALNDLLQQLDPRPDIRGREFERICAWYLRSAPEYRRKFRRVWLWSEWPDAWAADAGIDLVAEEKDGSLWAIQAKVYDQSYAIKKADVDSFLSESSRPGFSYRLLIATTDRLGTTAKRTLDDQREPVGYRLRSQLELASVAWPASPDDLRPRRPARKKPFPHVKEAIRATLKGFDRTDRGQLLMACGTGKTLAAMWISERLDAKRTLILVPSLSLLAQTLREWSANATEPFDYLAVCSDETVADEDQFVAHTAELGLPVTTDPDLIAAFLRRRGRRIVFATYQSSPQIAAAYGGRTPQFDLAVADEAHRCTGPVGNEFTTILDRDQIRAKRRLFMTATPRVYTQRVRDEAGMQGVEVASMDDGAVFGPVLHQLTFGEGIQRDLLSDYQVVVVGVDDETYRSYAEKGKFVTRDGETANARILAGQIGLAKSMRKYKLRRIISFHSRVKAARKFNIEMPDVIAWMPPAARPAGALWSNHVSGAMTSGHRDRLLLRFRELAPGERGLLSNARCLGEGVDVPSIDGVAFIDPRRSTIDIIQALGRAIRKSPDKKVGTIVLPVFLSEAEDPDQVLDESTFKPVWDVLRALRAHDEALGDELDDLRRGLGAGGSPGRPGKVVFDLPAGRVGADFVRAFNARLVEQTTSSWEFYFGLLERFVEREGHALVPAAYTSEDGFGLGAWVNAQRTRYTAATLDTARRERLESVSGWTWDAREAAWEEGFIHLKRFVEREGHARVPQETREEGYRLGGWVTEQRHAYRKGTLGPQRRARLEALPGWTWDVLEAAWEKGFASLQRFVEREGHARVREPWREDGFSLGRWVGKQRQAFREGRLGRRRRERLEAVPAWTWNTRETAWEGGFANLQRFAEREGHVQVPAKHREAGYELGTWVDKQRQAYRENRLAAERQARLEAQPGWEWRPADATWEEGFANLQRFVEREGHARVPRGWLEDGYKLGSWATSQRSLGRRGRLEPERRTRLEGLDGWAWDLREAAWEEGFAHLERFVEREGHSRVPQQWSEDGYRLGTWVSNQRTRSHRLNPERRTRLEHLVDWTWDPREAAWNEGYARLLRFAEREGHGRVPSAYRDDDGYQLGAWVSTQRRFRKRGWVSKEHAGRLEAVPGWVWSAQEANWEEGFAQLLAFVRREGHSCVPGDYRDDAHRLGVWVGTQRQHRRRGKLLEERARRLEALPGWAWDAR